MVKKFKRTFFNSSKGSKELLLKGRGSHLLLFKKHEHTGTQ